MSEPLEHPFGSPCWTDLGSSDPARSQEFYAALFGWTPEPTTDPQYGGYLTFALDGQPIAGMMQNDPASGAPDAWSTYLAVADVDATAQAALDAGGQTMLAPMTVGDQGRMAFLVDPSGAAVGIWQAGQHTGYALRGVPGAPGWHELATRDFGVALSFYTTVFGWQTEVLNDSDEFRYSTARFDGEDLIGVFDATAALPEGVPSHWQVYFGVEDTDAAVLRIAELGGSVLRLPSDTPYGRMALGADPTGATFMIAGPVTQAT